MPQDMPPVGGYDPVQYKVSSCVLLYFVGYWVVGAWRDRWMERLRPEEVELQVRTGPTDSTATTTTTDYDYDLEWDART